MSRKYIRISKDELEKILTDALSSEIKEAYKHNISGVMLLSISVIGRSMVSRVMESLPPEVYESNVVDFPNSNRVLKIFHAKQ